jgi:hypothetical protein
VGGGGGRERDAKTMRDAGRGEDEKFQKITQKRLKPFDV